MLRLVATEGSEFMTTQIPEEYRDLLERPVVAALGTVLPNGEVQVHPVWVDMNNGNLRVNTARGRQKDRNLRTRSHCTLLFVDPENPYRYLEVRGQVVDEREEGARDHINTLSKKYLGRDVYPVYPGETRVLYEVEPTKTTSKG